MLPLLESLGVKPLSYSFSGTDALIEVRGSSSLVIRDQQSHPDERLSAHCPSHVFLLQTVGKFQHL